MKLIADINECYIADWETNTGEVNARVLDVEMCEQLCSCANAFVQYELNNGATYVSLIKDGKAEIPTIEKSQYIKIGVYSTDTEDGICKKRYSPRPVSVFVPAGSYLGDGTEAPTPTAGTFEELLETINEVDKKTMQTLENVTNIWELEAGVYCASNPLIYATPNPPIETGRIDNFTKCILIVSVDRMNNNKRYFCLYGIDYIYFGYSFFNGFAAMGEYTKAKTRITNEINDQSTYEIPTAQAVYNFCVAKEDVLQAVNQSTNNPPQAVYSANVLNKDIIIPVTQTINQLANGLGGKENTSNRVNEIGGDIANNTTYPTTKAVFDFGLVILAEVEKMLENVNVNSSQLIAEAISTFQINTSAEVKENA